MTKWDDIKIGDFFTAKIDKEGDILLYQKITNIQEAYNAVLLNDGSLCYIYIGPNSKFNKVEVSFEIRNID